MDYTCLTRFQQQILCTVIENPGITHMELVYRLKTSTLFLKENMKILKEFYLIQDKGIKEKVIYYVDRQFMKDHPTILFDIQDNWLNEEKMYHLSKLPKSDYHHDYILTNRDIKILCMVINQPGLCQKQLAASLRVSLTSLSNSLKILKEHGLVQFIKIGSFSYYYVNNQFMEDHPNLINDQNKEESLIKIRNSLLEGITKYDYNQDYILTKRDKQILCMIIDHPGSTHKQLVNSLKIPGSTVTIAIRKLKGYGLVRFTKIGIHFYYYVNDQFMEDHPDFLFECQHSEYGIGIGLSDEELKKQVENERLMNSPDYDHSYILSTLERKILCMLINHPGFWRKKLASSLKVPEPVIRNELKILREHNLVQFIKMGRNSYYYVNANFMKEHPDFLITDQADLITDQNEWLDREKRRLLNKLPKFDYDHNYILTKKDNEVLCMMINHPSLCQKQLAASLKISETALSMKLKKLKEHGLVQFIKMGRNSYYYVNANFMKEHPDFLITDQTDLITDQNEWLDREKRRLLNELPKFDYDHNYFLTKKDNEVLCIMINHPGLCQKQLAASLKTSETALCKKLKKLKEHGLVQSIKIGATSYCYVNNQFIDDQFNFSAELESNINISQVKQLFSEKTLLLLIKNILNMSELDEAKIILNYFEFFEFYFSCTELVQLLYLLNICNLDTEVSLEILFFSNNYRKTNLLNRFKDVCLYLNRSHDNQNSTHLSYYKKRS